MTVLRVAAAREAASPVRIQRWNATFRAGDDFKLAFTLLEADGETPAHVDAAASVVTFHSSVDGRHGYDYGRRGLGLWSCGSPALRVAGETVLPAGTGRINFFIPGEQTGCLWGRYALRIVVDQYDGASTTVEGILQVIPSPGLQQIARLFVVPGVTPIGVGILPANLWNGQPADADFFPVRALEYGPDTLQQLGQFRLGGSPVGSARLGVPALVGLPAAPLGV